MPSDTLQQRFDRLNHLLVLLTPYWQLRPFAETSLPWQHNPALNQWLQAMDTPHRQQLESDMPARVKALTPLIEGVDELFSLSQVNPLPRHQPMLANDPLNYRVPGRKWQQVTAFSASLADERRPFLEWCAGKGHLGRVLHRQQGTAVTSLEYQFDLCQEAERLSHRHQSDCAMQQCDVLSDDVLSHLKPYQHAVALHACGRLHVRLLQLANAQAVQRISLSPCCYHLIEEEQYPPLSNQGRQSMLNLSRHDLRLCVQETVTAGAREQRLREKEFHWRLSFDLLQRELRGIDTYLNCPPIPRQLLAGSFAEFCHYMAAQKHISLEAAIDFNRLEKQGLKRVDRVSKIELVRQLFRRPLELWLVLDRALYLEEQGYQVSVGEFCDYHLTPRNLMIQAHKK
ncbi:SAM-dependent methyltransferase [Aestuariirhabdus sp. Z084]|uniref:methyltransferase n=1 Tax=Aestuariirhabdus haliotis TaxID=2918751 RepID=UPI00201B38AC|nr:methyltransferase [Aestuariirhabdus haliotis]MCL6415661.1 SAM-dependent methyltransferase [Aestuariirhabdus haliotis]MCL6419656.1 SAM-dependent methyltransferase [Aestuariirhabdus haliotis]